MVRRRTWWAALVVAAACLAGCSSGSSGSGHPAATTGPPRIIPTGAGVLSGTSPSNNGRVWVLAGNRQTKAISDIQISDAKVLDTVPTPASATSIAASVTGELGVGLGTKTKGAIQFRSASSGAKLGNVALPAPALSVAAGDDGTTFYVLEGTNGGSSSCNIAIVSAQDDEVQKTIPAPAACVGVQPTPDQSSVYVISSSGVITEISVATGRIQAQFSVSMTGIGLAMAPSGQTLFALGGPDNARAIGRVDLKTDSQDSVVPAAADSVAIAPGIDDRQVFDFVGTRRIGNVQIFQLPSE